MDVRVVDHPLAAARLTTLRDERTNNASFRDALRDLTLMLVYEATRDAATESVPVRTPLADTTGARLANPPLLVPVLRAGLGMVDQAHALIPEAHVGFVGVARDEQTHQPTPYLESLPDDLSGQPVFVLDPMLATGGSMAHTIGLLQARKAVDITAICGRRPGRHRGDREGGTRPQIVHRNNRRPSQRRRLHRSRTGRCGRPSVRAALELARELGQLFGDALGVGAGRRQITADARASNFDVGLDLRLGARRPHRDPHLSIGVSAGEDHRVGSALVGLRRSQIRHRHIESAQFRRRLGAQPGHHRRRVVGIAHRPRYRCRGVHAVASGKVVECVEHCASLLAQRYDQVAEQHRGADAVLVADRGRVDAVADRLLVRIDQRAAR